MLKNGTMLKKSTMGSNFSNQIRSGLYKPFIMADVNKVIKIPARIMFEIDIALDITLSVIGLDLIQFHLLFYV